MSDTPTEPAAPNPGPAKGYKNPLLGHDGPPGSEEDLGSIEEPELQTMLNEGPEQDPAEDPEGDEPLLPPSDV